MLVTTKSLICLLINYVTVDYLFEVPALAQGV